MHTKERLREGPSWGRTDDRDARGRRASRLTAALVALTCGLAACGGDSGANTGGPDATPTDDPEMDSGTPDVPQVDLTPDGTPDAEPDGLADGEPDIPVEVPAAATAFAWSSGGGFRQSARYQMGVSLSPGTPIGVRQSEHYFLVLGPGSLGR